MAVSSLSSRLFYIAMLVAWLVFTMVQAFLLYKLQLPLITVMIDSIMSTTLLLLVAFLILNAAKYYLPTSYQYISAIASSFVLAGVWLLVVFYSLKLVLGGSPVYLAFLHNSLVMRYFFGVLLLAIVNFAALLLDNREDQVHHVQRQVAIEKMAREAELYKLRQQLQPHFLFNSLNSINALIGQNPQQARRMVQQLSDFLRGTLKKEESQMVTVAEEIKYLNLYLEIEKVRFGNRLNTETLVHPAAADKKLPTLLLQPVVENAIKFGLYDTTGDTAIKIEAAMVNDDLQITVVNPHDPETAMPAKGTGFGLTSIKRRLYLLFGRNDLLQTTATDNIFTTIITIPQ